MARKNGEPLKITNRYKYLGITLQTTASSFRIHIEEKTAAAIKAMYNIKNITLLKLETAMKLFETIIASIITYGIELYWEKLKTRDMEKIESVKARYLKKAIGISKYAPNRMTYAITRETYFLDDVRNTMLLPSAEAYRKAIARKKQKEKENNTEFFGTDAMINTQWMESNQPQRHAIVGLAIHGYHHLMCTNKKFHQPNDQCVCESCEQYHYDKCKKRSRSLRELIRDR